jgi:hypothetical protein
MLFLEIVDTPSDVYPIASLLMAISLLIFNLNAAQFWNAG